MSKRPLRCQCRRSKVFCLKKRTSKDPWRTKKVERQFGHFVSYKKFMWVALHVCVQCFICQIINFCWQQLLYTHIMCVCVPGRCVPPHHNLVIFECFFSFSYQARCCCKIYVCTRSSLSCALASQHALYWISIFSPTSPLSLCMYPTTYIQWNSNIFFFFWCASCFPSFFQEFCVYHISILLHALFHTYNIHVHTHITSPPPPRISVKLTQGYSNSTARHVKMCVQQKAVENILKYKKRIAELAKCCLAQRWRKRWDMMCVKIYPFYNFSIYYYIWQSGSECAPHFHNLILCRHFWESSHDKTFRLM